MDKEAKAVGQDEKFECEDRELQDAVALPDGRVLLLMNRRLYIWSPAKRTLKYFDDATREFRADIIDEVKGNVVLCWDAQHMFIGDVLEERFEDFALPLQYGKIISAIIYDGKRVVFVTSNGDLRIWKGLDSPDDPFTGSKPIKHVFTGGDELEAHLEVMPNKRVLCCTSHEVVICDVE